jgi:hypothetical protein
MELMEHEGPPVHRLLTNIGMNKDEWHRYEIDSYVQCEWEE